MSEFDEGLLDEAGQETCLDSRSTEIDSALECRMVMEGLTREVDMLVKSNTLLRLELCDPESIDDPVFLEAVAENEALVKMKIVRLDELKHLLLQLDPAFRQEMLAAGHVLRSGTEAEGAAVADAATIESPLVAQAIAADQPVGLYL